MYRYKFKTGKFAGRTMEQVILRFAPRLYWRAAWAEEKLPDIDLPPKETWDLGKGATSPPDPVSRGVYRASRAPA